MECQTLFSGKKNIYIYIINLSYTEFAPRVVKVKLSVGFACVGFI